MADFEHITLIGVGLIGGSLGLAVKRRQLARSVVGVGWRDATLIQARDGGAIDRWTLDVAEGCRDADLVVLCTPVGLVADKAAEALPAMKPGSILTDVASTKAMITARIEPLLPDAVAFVPAHPMAGSERRGIENARADLFEGARVILTPAAKTPADATAAVRRMWQAVGAAVEELDAHQHDRIVADISHMPHLVAPAILNAVADDSLPYAATGMRDTTRIAASDVKLWIDIFKDNRHNVLDALRQFGLELDAVQQALDQRDWDTLATILDRAHRRRRALEGSDDQ